MTVSEKIVGRKSLAPKAKAIRREVLIMMRIKHQDHPFQRAEPAKYSNDRRSSRYTLWKPRGVRFCHTFSRERERWMNKTCTGSQEVQQL